MHKAQRPVIALGTFDGLHPGHRAVLRACMELARQKGEPSMVYTFLENPRSLFGQAPLELMRAPEKIRRMQALGIERVEAVHFTKALSALSPEAFIDMLCTSYDPCALVCGADYSFGAGGRGDSRLLAELGAQRGLEVRVVPLVTLPGEDGQIEKISSTRIRRALEQGNRAEAARLMCGGEAQNGE